MDQSGKPSLEQDLKISNGIKIPEIISLGLSKLSNQQECLEPGSTTLVPLWIRPDQPGRHSIQILFVYQSVDPRDKGNYRTLRITKTVEVHPSLRINAFTRSSLLRFNEFILGIETSNIRSSFEIIARQITCVSPTWKITRIDEG